jgi:hypothetical protein
MLVGPYEFDQKRKLPPEYHSNPLNSEGCLRYNI